MAVLRRPSHPVGGSSVVHFRQLSWPFQDQAGAGRGVRAAPGMLPVAILAREKKIPNLILPSPARPRRLLWKAWSVSPVSSLLDVLDMLNGAVMASRSASRSVCRPRSCSRSCHSSPLTSRMCAGSRGPGAHIGGCGGREPQHHDDRAAGVGEDDAGQASAVDPGAPDV
jgi:hypothetical protein